MPPTIFSPTGRLHPVERVVQAAKSPNNPRSNLLMAIRCPKDGSVVVVSTVTTSPHLNVTTTLIPAYDNNNNDDDAKDGSASNETTTATASLFLANASLSSPAPVLFDLTPNCMAATAGNAVDGHVLKTKLLAFAEGAMDYAKDDIRAAVLARRLADHLQVPTQTVGGKGGRMLASHAVILGDGQLWRIDPTGQFWKCNAIVLGRYADKAEEVLYKRITEADEDDGPQKDLEEVLREMTWEEAIEVLCDCMNRVIWPEKPAATPVLPNVAVSRVYWRGVILKDDGTNGLSRRVFRRGAFLPPNAAAKSTT